MNKDFIVTGIDRIIFVGREEYPQEIAHFNSGLTTNELIYHLDGNQTVHFNGKVLECQKDTIRFLPKGENREYVVNYHEHGDCIDVFFDTDLPIEEEAFVTQITNNAAIANMFKKIFALWVSKNEGYYFECVSLLYKILAEMQKQTYIPQNQYEKIKPALLYIENNFLTENISIPHLAEICHISEAYLKKLFDKKFGVSPSKYIIQMKINHAGDLLQSERYSVSQVAKMCGYDDSCFFSRQFKKYAGASPAVFAKKYKSSK